ncbi:hypothetical protein TNCV_15531 [Trichonephila clavipes]|nr:hypothetical protein TNCV_15531 [Trichonephila clavipes]
MKDVEECRLEDQSIPGWPSGAGGYLQATPLTARSMLSGLGPWLSVDAPSTTTLKGADTIKNKILYLPESKLHHFSSVKTTENGMWLRIESKKFVGWRKFVTTRGMPNSSFQMILDMLNWRQIWGSGPLKKGRNSA